jgi:hypothetical protein
MRLEQILNGHDPSDIYTSMAEFDRIAVLEILRDTKPEFAVWLSKAARAKRERAD